MHPALLPRWTARTSSRWLLGHSAGRIQCGTPRAVDRCAAYLQYYSRTTRLAHSAPIPSEDQSLVNPAGAPLDDEAVARLARRTFGDSLPDGYLTPGQLKSYVRLFGEPEPYEVAEEGVEGEENDLDEVDADMGTGVMFEEPDGSLVEVEYIDDLDESTDGTEPSFEDMLGSRDFLRLRKSKRGKFFAKATKQQLDETVLFADMNKADEASLAHLDKEWKKMDQDEQAVYLDDVRYMKLEQYLRDADRHDEADELLQCLFIYLESQASAMRASAAAVEETPEVLEEEYGEEDIEAGDAMEEEQVIRTHPLTLENRFATFPSTLQMPKEALTDPTVEMLSAISSTHLTDAAQRLFGGPGLPYSTSNPAFAKSIPQKPMPLDISQDKMSEIEADAFLATIVPGAYAGLMSALVDTRKRMGSAWLTGLINKEGGPRILDAGSGGAGVIAFRELLRAEWERMNDYSDDPEATRGIATIDGREGGAPAEPPSGRATVLSGSAPLRQRASYLLDNTTFVPRLPDYLHASNQQAAQQGKFDIILAPYTLWALKEGYLRKQYVANLWSLLNADGGVLILLEKGVPRGFEVIAGARKFLLDTRIASPDNTIVSDETGSGNIQGVREKEPGMIIAPCTNHSACPMYTRPGVSPGRKDFCHFEQRYVRPPYLQKILRAKDKNHEDLKFSYLSVMRGQDLRQSSQIVQNDSATSLAFAGYEHPSTISTPSFDPTAPAIEEPLPDQPPVHSLSLPRLVLPPLKRTGHVILDLCTPSGSIERWTVSRSFSRQAFRDARKANWGDIWALGAKTRVPRSLKTGGDNKFSAAGVDMKTVRLNRKAKAKIAEGNGVKRVGREVFDVNVDPMTGRAGEGDVKRRAAGRMRRGPKVAGVRDRRNKSGKQRVRRNEE